MTRAVVDTGVFVSGLIHPAGIPGKILKMLRDARFIVVYTTPIVEELVDVLTRPFFRRKYQIDSTDVLAVVNLIRLRGELILPNIVINECRDPKDNKFLEAAIAASANVIVSGDNDLLVLSPFRNIFIQRPAEFIEYVETNR